MADQGDGTTQFKPKTGHKELPVERRMLLAFILMGLVLFLTPYFVRQDAPRPPAKAPAATAPAPAPAGKPPAPPAAAAASAAKPEARVAPVSAPKEEDYLIETDLYRVRFSNRGAVVRSWVLKKYRDGAGKQLELVNASAAARTGYPFSLEFKGKPPEAGLNQALFAARVSPDGLGIDFDYSNGAAVCRKSFRFRKDSYLSEVSSEASVNGAPVPHLLAWRGGFGDASVPNAAAALHTVYFDAPANKLNVSQAKVAKEGPVSASGPYSFAGIEDAYFVAVFLPAGDASVEIRTFSDTVAGAAGGKEEPHAGAAVGAPDGNRFSVFVGPKDMDILRTVNPKLVQVVDFGWFAFIARPLFVSVNWINNHWVHNYGWSIVVVTIIINFLLLPLRFSSMKSMKKMQALQPHIAAINEKYKGISLRDPRKANQNQEVMDLYKKHGVNPMGGCMPMLLQIPFFIAFYKVLTVAIEMRGAEWLWVRDLSQPETLPIRILPVAMIVSQFIMQKMTPSTTADPTQQRVMMLMPLMLGFMFYGVSSGLVLYWLTGNVVGIAQQWIINRATPAAAIPPAPGKKKKDGRN